MCQKLCTKPWPCGHALEPRVIYCDKAKGKLLYKKRNREPCDDVEVVTEEPDMTEPCTGTCLAQVWSCHVCSGGDRDTTADRKLVGWTCTSCGHVRCVRKCKVWRACQCDCTCAETMRVPSLKCRRCATGRCGLKNPALDAVLKDTKRRLR